MPRVWRREIKVTNWSLNRVVVDFWYGTMLIPLADFPYQDNRPSQLVYDRRYLTSNYWPIFWPSSFGSDLRVFSRGSILRRTEWIIRSKCIFITNLHHPAPTSRPGGDGAHMPVLVKCGTSGATSRGTQT